MPMHGTISSHTATISLIPSGLISNVDLDLSSPYVTVGFPSVIG